MDYEQDFATVNLILETSFETRGVDAFVLSLIKAEKQIRRVFTFLIFQNPAFTSKDYWSLRETLANNKRIYFKGFIKGINLILPKQLKEIYGDKYDDDIYQLLEFTKERNKIFHGQITFNGLDREDLITRVDYIKIWCKNLAEKLNLEIGYDGFSHSYHKSNLILTLNSLNKFDTIEKYRAFLKSEIQI